MTRPAAPLGAVSRFVMIPGAHHFSTGVWLPGGIANTQLRDFILATEAAAQHAR